MMIILFCIFDFNSWCHIFVNLLNQSTIFTRSIFAFSLFICFRNFLCLLFIDSWIFIQNLYKTFDDRSTKTIESSCWIVFAHVLIWIWFMIKCLSSQFTKHQLFFVSLIHLSLMHLHRSTSFLLKLSTFCQSATYIESRLLVKSDRIRTLSRIESHENS